MKGRSRPESDCGPSAPEPPAKPVLGFGEPGFWAQSQPLPPLVQPAKGGSGPRTNCSPFRPGEVPDPGPSPAWEGWYPLFEDSFEELERDAFAALFRAGEIVEGDLIPWRGYREAWLSEHKGPASKRKAEASWLSVVAAKCILSAVERAFQRDGDGAFGCLVEFATQVAVADAARVYEATVVRGRENRQGRKGEIDAAQLEALRCEARDLAKRKPHLKLWAIASELVARHGLRMTAETLQRNLGKLAPPKPKRRKP